MRKLVMLFLVAFTLISCSQATFAQVSEPVSTATIVDERTSGPDLCGNSAGGGGGHCHDSSRNVITQPAATGSSSVNTQRTSGSGSTSATTYVPYNRLTIDSDGNPCVTTGFVQEGHDPTNLAPDTNQNHTEILNGNNLTGRYPRCPQVPQVPGQLTPAQTRTMIAVRVWEQDVPLPKPQPSIAPGRAITGKAAYLETRGRLEFSYTEETIFGPLRIDAHGSYTIAWGDGETTGPHTYEGRPWPNGQITHEYVNVGAYDVVVTEKWTATWSLDGESGVLRALQTTGRIDDFPVEQIQAVIKR